MTRMFGQTISLDMLVLWLVETLACFLALYASFDHGHFLPVTAALRVTTEAAIRAADITFLLGAICIVLGLYKPSAILQTRMLFLTMAVAALCATPIFWSLLADGPADAGIWRIEAIACWLLLLAGTRLAYAAAVRSGRFKRRVVVVGEGQAATDLVASLRAMRPMLFDVSLAGAAGAAGATASRPWRTITTEAPDHVAARGPSRVVDAAAFWETQFGRVDLRTLQASHVAGIARRVDGESRAAAVLRRTVDIGVASAVLVLGAPLMLLTALAVKLDSRGPVIYRQERVGQGGRSFVILKFRSMRTDAERDGVAVWASVRDSRVTRVGAFIRKVRIDELPQVFNILRGDMSLVGPRPERPTLARELNAAIPFFSSRTMVKPGLTGWAQINSAYTASALEACEKLSYDLYYVKNRTLALDLMILVATVRILIFQVGSR